MKRVALFTICLILLALILATGCSNSQYTQSQNTNPNSRYSTSNTTYANYGFSFEYPDNFVPVELGFAGDANANMNNGLVQLKGTEDNITISWLKTFHRPPNIPVIYNTLYTTLKQDPQFSNVNVYILNTYSSTLCGNAAFIGRVSYYDNVAHIQTNEGIIMWHHPSQDRFYMIDIGSPEDYYSSILGNLARFQRSFKCDS